MLARKLRGGRDGNRRPTKGRAFEGPDFYRPLAETVSAAPLAEGLTAHRTRSGKVNHGNPDCSGPRYNSTLLPFDLPAVDPSATVADCDLGAWCCLPDTMAGRLMGDLARVHAETQDMEQRAGAMAKGLTFDAISDRLLSGHRRPADPDDVHPDLHDQAVQNRRAWDDMVFHAQRAAGRLQQPERRLRLAMAAGAVNRWETEDILAEIRDRVGSGLNLPWREQAREMADRILVNLAASGDVHDAAVGVIDERRRGDRRPGRPTDAFLATVGDVALTCALHADPGTGPALLIRTAPPHDWLLDAMAAIYPSRQLRGPSPYRGGLHVQALPSPATALVRDDRGELLVPMGLRAAWQPELAVAAVIDELAGDAAAEDSPLSTALHSDDGRAELHDRIAAVLPVH